MLLAFLSWLIAGVALGGARVALVIGNGAYEHAPHLLNPVHDATDVAAVLRKLGYSVDLITDARKAGLEAALTRFATVASGAEVAVIYYSGHGVEVGGVNFLLPVEATVTAESTVPLEAVSLPTVMGVASGARQLGLVVLDACRSNPLADSMRRVNGTKAVQRGLAAVEPGAHLLVAYATRDGHVASDGTGRNSPYTAAILEALAVPGLEVGLFWRRVHDNVVSATNSQQDPFTYGSLGAEQVYLNPSAVSTSSYDPRAAELAMWQAAQSLGTPDAYREYLAKYPQGQFSQLARLQIDRVSRPATDSAAVVPQHPQGQAGAVSGRSSGPQALDTQLVNAKRVFQAGDYAKAFSLFQQLAEAGNDAGMAWLGRMYAIGVGVPRDDVQAVSWVRRAAERGNGLGMAVLGVMYANGRGGLPRDDVQALSWIRRAAESGDGLGMAQLGAMYANGRGGLPKDDVQALSWFRRAAESGDGLGMALVGSMYGSGRGGLPKDDARALSWYQKAVAAGSGLGMSNLGVLYANGQGGLPRDDVQAVSWFRRAVETGDSLGMANLGAMYGAGRGGLPKDDVQAVSWYQKAAAAGGGLGMSNLGVMYLNGGGGLPRDEAQALFWFRKAVEAGDGSGMYNMGFMSENGRGGLPRDISTALAWYRKALAAGVSAASKEIERLERSGVRR
jgi:uncharacterized protein